MSLVSSIILELLGYHLNSLLDYERALGELLELDDTLRATLEYLEEIGEAEQTLVVLTADHARESIDTLNWCPSDDRIKDGFDVWGSSDVQYLKAQTTDRKKRDAIGVYTNSGLSNYVVEAGSRPDNHTVLADSSRYNFPLQWNPRYAIAAGFSANPDHRETYETNINGPRLPAVNSTPAGDDYVVNPKDQPSGFVVNGTLPVNENQGVHSLSDVAVYAQGPGAAEFRGVYE